MGCAYSATRSSSIIQRTSASSGDGSTPAGSAEASAFLSFLKSPEGLSPFRAAGIEE